MPSSVAYVGSGSTVLKKLQFCHPIIGFDEWLAQESRVAQHAAAPTPARRVAAYFRLSADAAAWFHVGVTYVTRCHHG